MFKITAMVSLLLIGSALWASALSCDSCGSECLSACGTRHFRACCFNYLRRKRGPDAANFWGFNPHESRADGKKQFPAKMPAFPLENLVDFLSAHQVMNEIKPYPNEETSDNRLQLIYEP